MSTITISTTSFNLEAAVAAGLPEWTAENRAELVEAIRQDSADIVGQSDRSLGEVQQWMLQQFFNSLVASTSQAAKPTDRVSSSKFDFATAIGETLPFLSKEARQWVAREIYACLEVKVGERLTCSMPRNKLDEFDCFVNEDKAGMKQWLAEHFPDYKQDQRYRDEVEANPEAPAAKILSGYGAIKWLELNAPQYPQVVKQTTADLMVALRKMVSDQGEDRMKTWVTVHADWVNVVLEKAAGSHDIMVGASYLIGHHGGQAVEEWALIQRSLGELDERIDSMFDEYEYEYEEGEW